MLNSMILTVSQVNAYIKLLLQGDKNLKNIFISGEISDFKHNFSSGHAYFSLKDGISVIRVVMFSSNFNRIRFIPKDGMRVLIRGSISLYEASGQYQIYAEDMQQDGVGESYIKLQMLKNKLEKEGLFKDEIKKKLTRYPKKIGVITSSSGAVMHDIKNVISRRYPICKIEVFSANVQGENSENKIIEGISYFNNKKVSSDVIIIARGGGASEDLSVFNKENIARAVVSSRIPIISAIGHETDWTICDYAADMRAPTPSAAAELAVPDKKELIGMISMLQKRMHTAYINIIKLKKDIVEYKLKEIKAFSPKNEILLKKKKILQIEKDMLYGLRQIFNNLEFKINTLNAKLNAMNPFNVLLRGYAMASIRKRNICSVLDVKEGDRMELKFSDGTVSFCINDMRREEVEK